VEERPEHIRLTASRAFSAGRALFFGLVFALMAAALIDMFIGPRTNIPFFGLIMFFIGWTVAGGMAPVEQCILKSRVLTT
jgi:hypothetical protein